MSPCASEDALIVVHWNMQEWEYARLYWDTKSYKDEQWSVEDKTGEIFHHNPGRLVEVVNRWGGMGWEVVAPLPTPEIGFLLKRPKQ